MIRFQRADLELIDRTAQLVRDMIEHAETCPTWHLVGPHQEHCDGWAEMLVELKELSRRTVLLYVREGLIPESELDDPGL